jgi:carbamoyl-phosphate synthase small subunit
VEASLALEDGRIFRGWSFGARGERTGEVVFNTSMAGYQEVVTDPSYRGQIVVMTCPEIGNYGTNRGDEESAAPQVEGFVVRKVSERASSWRSDDPLPDYLRAHGVPGLTGIDTRALTRHLRTRGTMRGVLSTIDHDADSLVRKAASSPSLDSQDLVARVSCRAAYESSCGRDPRFATDLGVSREGPRLRCVAYDFGIKRNILRLLGECGFDVTVVPAATPAADALALAPDGVFLSNGPGDPVVATYAIRAVRDLVGRVPIFGICLGHQIAALALGGRTFKLKFGHRGGNHPVQDVRSGRVAITAQNHGYAVDTDRLPAGVEVTHVNLNDMTCEGFAQADLRLVAVQYHPEASPGPHDSHQLFRQFRALVAGPAPASGAPEGAR